MSAGIAKLTVAPFRVSKTPPSASISERSITAETVCAIVLIAREFDAPTATPATPPPAPTTARAPASEVMYDLSAPTTMTSCANSLSTSLIAALVVPKILFVEKAPAKPIPTPTEPAPAPPNEPTRVAASIEFCDSASTSIVAIRASGEPRSV